MPRECGERWESLRRALLLSLLAAVVIEVLLAQVYARGYETLFTGPPLALLAFLGAVALLVYRDLTRYLGWGDVLFAVAGLAGIGLAATALGGYWAGLWGAGRAAWLVVGAYFMELVVASRLYSVLSPLSRAWTIAFVGGAGLFILSLPLVVAMGAGLALVPIAGNMVKAIGIAGLLGVIGSLCSRSQ